MLFRSLKVVLSVKSNRTGNVKDVLDLKLNNTSTGLSERYLQGNGTGTSSATLTNYYGEVPAATTVNNVFSNWEAYIPNYTSSNYKSFSIDSAMEDNATLAIATLHAGLWSNTSAINQITFTVVNGTGFAAGSTATLYGVL